jgi:hypothetical protein
MRSRVCVSVRNVLLHSRQRIGGLGVSMSMPAFARSLEQEPQRICEGASGPKRCLRNAWSRALNTQGAPSSGQLSPTQCTEIGPRPCSLAATRPCSPAAWPQGKAYEAEKRRDEEQSHDQILQIPETMMLYSRATNHLVPRPLCLSPSPFSHFSLSHPLPSVTPLSHTLSMSRPWHSS